MSGARLALTATEELQRSGGRYALATMCIGVGQGIALALEREWAWTRGGHLGRPQGGAGSGNPGGVGARPRHRPRVADEARVQITPTYSGCPATLVIEQSIREALDAAGLSRRRDRDPALAALDDRLDQRARPPGCRPTASPRPTSPRPRPARNAARPTPRKSAASARPRARRSGAASRAWSRSTASNATAGPSPLRDPPP